MTDKINKIISQIDIENEDTISKALDQVAKLKDLSDEEKVDISSALSVLFYHDHAGMVDMIKLANRAEKQIAKFGEAVLPFLIKEVTNADAESAAHLGRAIALNGTAAVDLILKAWDENRDDDFAIINLIQTLSYFRVPETIKVLPEILVASKAKNHQVRAMALNAAGRLSQRLHANLLDEKMRTKMFDSAFTLISDSNPLVRANAARALGKMLSKRLLNDDQREKLLKSYNAILGNDEKHEWDYAYIVRHEAQRFLPFCKAGESLADRYKQSFKIVAKRELCTKTFHFEIEAPLLAKKLKAGQFIIVRPHEFSERIPLSICGWDETKGTIQIIVMAVGKTSTGINNMNVGNCLADIVGPLGERSHVKKHDGTCVVIGGGYGTGAIIPTARDLKALGNRVIGIVGARNKDLLIMVPELEEACDEVMLTTNDGSVGIEGFVTHALQQILDRGEKLGHVLAVGPVPMMKAVSDMTKPLGVETYVSLNAIMVDGTGMCGACRVSVGGETKFACFHGPDFDGHKVDFDQLVKRQKMFVKEEQKALETLGA